MLYAVKTYMQHSCFQKHFTVIIYSPKKASVALIAVGTSNIELKETLVPHHIKTAGCHRHEPNRLSLPSSTYKRQIRQLESGLRLLMWQISNGWGETLPIAAHPYITGPELSLLCGILTSLFTLRPWVKADFWYFWAQSMFCLWLEVSKICFERAEKVHACFSAHTVVFPTRCAAVRLSVLTWERLFLCISWALTVEYKIVGEDMEVK